MNPNGYLTLDDYDVSMLVHDWWIGTILVSNVDKGGDYAHVWERWIWNNLCSLLSILLDTWNCFLIFKNTKVIPDFRNTDLIQFHISISTSKYENIK